MWPCYNYTICSPGMVCVTFIKSLNFSGPETSQWLRYEMEKGDRPFWGVTMCQTHRTWLIPSSQTHLNIEGIALAEAQTNNLLIGLGLIVYKTFKVCFTCNFCKVNLGSGIGIFTCRSPVRCVFFFPFNNINVSNVLLKTIMGDSHGITNL